MCLWQVVLMASAKLRQGNTSNGVEGTTMNGESSQMQPTSVSRPWSWQQGVTWQVRLMFSKKRASEDLIIYIVILHYC